MECISDSHVKEVHDWIKAITINWSIPIWDQSISQVTNKVYMRTQNISSRGYKLGKGWNGIFSIEKAFYIFHIKEIYLSKIENHTIVILWFYCIFSNLNFFFEKYSSWERIGSCIFSNLHFFFGKYSSWERIGSCKEVQFLGENASPLS